MRIAFVESILLLWRGYGLAVCFIVLGGCSFTTTYNLAYVPNDQSQLPKPVDGKGLIYTEKADDEYVFTGNPTSYSGHATTLTIPIGAITKGIAEKVFRGMFKDGFDLSNTTDNFLAYRVVIRPKVSNFSYEYNQLKNLGFAITPTVRVSLSVKLLNVSGKVYWEKNYESGDKEGASYMISTSPGEEISKVAHVTIFDLMTEAAKDIREQLISQTREQAGG